MAIERSDASVIHDERAHGRRFGSFDFRRPSKLGRDVLRVLELAHETFTRRLSSGWGSEMRSIVQVEPLGMDQMAYDDHIRSMPNPNVAIVMALPPLPGAIVIDLNVQLALAMVERLLGAAPSQVVLPPRRPSEVETDLIRFLVRQMVTALRETLEPLVEVEPQLLDIEYNPQLVQVAAPSDTTLLLSYAVTVSQGVQSHGYLTIAYPGPTLNPLLERLAIKRQGEERDPQVDALAREAVESAVSDVPVTLSIRLTPSTVATEELARLQVGDVLRLDHRVDAPAHGVVGGLDVMTCHLGRRGRRFAVQVQDWIAQLPMVPAGAAPPSHDSDNLPAKEIAQ